MHFDVIQVGAHIGKGDRIYEEVQTGRMRSGILLEPIPELHAELTNNYSRFAGDFRVIRAALHPSLPEATLSYVADVQGLPAWSCAIGSIVPDVTEKHARWIRELSGRDPVFVSITVPCITFHNLFEEHQVESVGTLCIDAEGMDKDILLSFPFERCRPQRIIFETHHLADPDRTEAVAYLSERGYRGYDDGIDYVADLEMSAVDRSGHETAMRIRGVVLPDKQENIMTISNRFKRDVIDFFDENGRRDCVVEIGSYLGYSTRFLASLFSQVVSVDVNIDVLSYNRHLNSDLDNIDYVHMDVYGGDWSTLAIYAADVVMIDANHEYRCVASDIERSIATFGKPILILDDYGAWPGVKQAVDERIGSGRLQVLRYVGHPPGWHIKTFGDTVDWEGIICRVV
ncbi:MAG: FkbM family methyltransferase [Kofleriaceae bacterium]